MNTVGLVFLATVARVTALAFIGIAAAFALKRRGPSAVALATITTLSALVAVTALSLSPWPRFWTFEVATAPLSLEKPAEPAGVTETLPNSGAPVMETRPVATGTTFFELTRMFLAELRVQNVPNINEGPEPWRWPAWIALALLAAAAIGLARLTLALRAVRFLRQRSTPVTDTALLDELDLLRAEIRCVRAVALRVTHDLSTPATVGWRHPILLVPSDWSCWQPDERRAALAHELAHVQGGDYLSGLWAQACLSFHLYHPLAHWLVARFRLEQELAADAAAARFSGGSRAYLEALARLALKRSGPLEPSPGAGLWPARPFLPTRGMFLRRMEMLRDPNSAPRNSQPLRPIGRALTVATLGAAALLVAGLRGPLQARVESTTVESVISAQDNAPAADNVFDLSHAPADTVAAIAGRPSAILGRPEFKPIRDLLKPEQKSMVGTFNMPYEEIESFQILFAKGIAPGQPVVFPPTMIIHATKPQDWKVVAGKFIGNPETVKFEGESYVRTKTPPIGLVFMPVDDRTSVVGNEADVKALVLARKGGIVAHVWDKAWAKVAKGHLALAVDPQAFLDIIPKDPMPGTAQAALFAEFGMIAPLVEKATGYAIGLDAEKGVAFDLVATAPDEESAKVLDENLTAFLTLGKNYLNVIRRRMANSPPGLGNEAQLTNLMLDFAGPMLAGAKVARPEGTVVEVRAGTDKNFATVANSAVVQAVFAARAAARRSQSMNNLKQIALAMHNFRDVYGHFPPAVLRDKPGKVPYSWRVAILPFVDQAALYQEYDFSEPWDGPKNKKLLERMPAVYRNPNDDPRSVNSAYYVPIGDTTIFPPEGSGMEMSNIFDGTSNTIMTIETKRPIPWSKPEDIPVVIDLKKAGWTAPELGGFSPGGFLVGMADGSVRAFPTVFNKDIFRALFTRKGGEVIDWNAFDNGLRAPNAPQAVPPGAAQPAVNSSPAPTPARARR